MRRCLPLILLVLLATAPLLAQPKPAPKDGPRVIVTRPIGLTPGAATKLTVRGFRIDGAKEVRLGVPRAAVKALRKGKVAAPSPEDVKWVGDSEVEAEVTPPGARRGQGVPLEVPPPPGEPPPHRLLVDRGPVLAEKEPNNGFRQAQPVQVPQVVEGRVDQNQDVDVL